MTLLDSIAHAIEQIRRATGRGEGQPTTVLCRAHNDSCSALLAWAVRLDRERERRRGRGARDRHDRPGRDAAREGSAAVPVVVCRGSAAMPRRAGEARPVPERQ